LRGACSIDSEILNTVSKKDPTIKVTYKDKKTLEADPTSQTFVELSEYFDRHSRQLQIKESIES
jgi:large subunit ribosomal protein L53